MIGTVNDEGDNTVSIHQKGQSSRPQILQDLREKAKRESHSLKARSVLMRRSDHYNSQGELYVLYDQLSKARCPLRVPELTELIISAQDPLCGISNDRAEEPAIRLRKTSSETVVR